MYKKAFLITVFIISLVLVGLMMLIANARNSSVLEDFTTLEEKFVEADESVEKNIDSLQQELKVATHPSAEIVTQFNVKAAELLTYIELLKKELIPYSLSDYNYESPEIAKNNAIFFLENGQYSEKGKQFLAKIEAYENIVEIIHLQYPKINKQAFKIRTDIRENIDWLNYNFMGFPVITSYVNLTAMESTIKSKQELIYTIVLNN